LILVSKNLRQLVLAIANAFAIGYPTTKTLALKGE